MENHYAQHMFEYSVTGGNVRCIPSLMQGLTRGCYRSLGGNSQDIDNSLQIQLALQPVRLNF